MVKGYLHSIESMGLLDGPGTRTIFFLQGCPLRCAYCHNPDTIKAIGGQIIDSEWILNTAKRYKPYYGEEGGVTFSGGEPLLQGEFLYESLKLLKEEGYNTCIDTSGFGNPKFYPDILPLVDTLILDVKAFDEESFKDLTMNSGFKTYLSFIDNLKNNGFEGQVWARHVMVPGFTDNYESMKKFVDILKPINHLIDMIEILPYHTSAIKKYKDMGIAYRLEGVEAMDKDKAKEFEIYANKLFADNLRADRLESSKKKDENTKILKDGEIVSLEEKQDMFLALRNLPLLNEIEEKDIEAVLSEIILTKIKKDDFIFQTGDSPDFMYLIISGQVKIYFNTIDGEEQIFYIYKEGDFIGGHNLLMKTDYVYMGRALTDCKVVAIPKDTFYEYFYNSPELLRSVLSKSFERIRWAEDLIQRLSTNNATMKTAALLIKLNNIIGIKTDEGIRLELSLNREELGNYSGLRRETITRKLGEFKELGYIDIEGNKVIIIKDLEALEKYVL